MNIQQYWLILKRRWLPASGVFVTVSLLSVGALSMQQDIFEASGKLRYSGEDRATALTGIGLAMGDLDPLVESNNPMMTEMEIIRSVPITQEVLERVNNQISALGVPPLQRPQLLSKFQLSNPQGTDILRISYRDENPELAKLVIDTVMQVYLEHHIQDNRAEAVAARQFLERELPAAEARVKQAEADLRQFQETNRVAALEEEKVAMVGASEDLRQRFFEAESALADASAQVNTFSQQLGMDPRTAIAITALSQSPGVQTVLAQMQEVESQLAVERVRYQDASPVVQALLQRRENLQTLLDERVANTLKGQALGAGVNLQGGELQAALVGDLARTEAVRRGLSQQLQQLSNAQAQYQQRIAVLPRLEQEQRELLRRLEAAQGTYSLLLERLHEARVTENQTVGNARIVQQAFVADRPVEPRKGMFLATGGLVALLLAAATAAALESQDTYVKTAREARNLFELTLLGVIPLDKQGARSGGFSRTSAAATPEVVVKNAPNAAIAEAYRMLQANIRFLSSDRAIKTVVVTSSIVGEGKSVISANLAMAKAQLGHRVLLIDADMRCPRQHQIWDVCNDRGLSNLIVEQRTLEHSVKPIAENLDLLAAGVIPPNPTALIDSQRMAAVIEQAAQHYDFVVIDTPALNIAADVSMLGRLSDGVLLVTRPGLLDLDSAMASKERLAQFGQMVLGQVINGVVPENEPYSYYYFTGHEPERQGIALKQSSLS